MSKDELSTRMMVGSKLAKAIQEIKRAWAPNEDKQNDKDKNGKGSWWEKADRVDEVTAEENTPTNNPS